MDDKLTGRTLSDIRSSLDVLARKAGQAEAEYNEWIGMARQLSQAASEEARLRRQKPAKSSESQIDASSTASSLKADREQSPPVVSEDVNCQNCGAVLKPGLRFCTKCGHDTTRDSKDHDDSSLVCPECQNINRLGTKFCTNCGTSLVVAREVKCPNCDTSAREGLKFCTNCGYSLAVVIAGKSTGSRSIVQTLVDLPSQSPSTGTAIDSMAPSVARLQRTARSVMPVIFGTPGRSALPNLGQTSLKAPLPRMQPLRVFNLSSGPAQDVARQASQSFRNATRPGGKEAELPPQPGLWSFRKATSNLVPSSLKGRREAGQTSAGWPTLALGRVIRAVLFEANIYREVAANSKVQWEAWIIALATIFAAAFGAIFLSLIRGTFGGIRSLPGIFLIQTVAWLVSVWAMHAGATLWLKSPLSYNQFFRALSYGRIPAVLQFVPILGYLTIPWVLVAHASAIRDLTGGSAVKSVVLAIGGLVAMIIAMAIVGPAVGYIF